MPSGFLLINKPSGPTSHDIVDAVRRITGVRRVGHAGTLDPFADGLLIVGVGRGATKRLDSFKGLSKTYLATLRLGATSDTDDRTGRVVISNFQFPISKREVEDVLQQFVGEIEQVPPMYSAKKIGGKKLYDLARKGEVIERKPTKINIYSIKLLHYQSSQGTRNKEPRRRASSLRGGQETRNNHLESEILNLQSAITEVSCSPGTYIRALARDIGARLGCGAFLEQLTRTKIGPFTLVESVTLNQFDTNNWFTYLSSGDDLEARSQKPEARVEPQYSTSLTPGSKLQAPITKVLVFGTFDRLHAGHIDLFRQARGLGDQLIVGVGRDTVVKHIKGNHPQQYESERRRAVQSCGLVSEAKLLPENPEERFIWIKQVSPDVIALGYDQTTFTEHFEEELRQHHLNCRVIRLKPYYPEIFKSSKMET